MSVIMPIICSAMDKQSQLAVPQMSSVPYSPLSATLYQSGDGIVQDDHLLHQPNVVIIFHINCPAAGDLSFNTMSLH